MKRFSLAAVAFLWIASGALCASPARASDFWEEVRTPGLRAYTRLVLDARRALNTGQNQAALSTSEEAIALLAARSEAQVVRMRALAALNRTSDAHTATRALLLQNAEALNDAQDAAVAARVSAESQDYALAISILERTVNREAPGASRASLFVFLGDMIQCQDTTHIREAVAAYRAGVRAIPADARARLGLALALRRAGERVEAQSALGSLLALGGRMGNTLSPLRAILPASEIAAREGIALDAMQDTAGAREAWTRAAADGPWQEFARRELALVGTNTVPAPRPARAHPPVPMFGPRGIPGVP
ncbi:MAG: hypothetical protein IPK60_17145 [Sandaracinaceae bacterium]|nr:hypothetical protein [Sandaracinaceae bacterium]